MRISLALRVYWVLWCKLGSKETRNERGRVRHMYAHTSLFCNPSHIWVRASFVCCTVDNQNVFIFQTEPNVRPHFLLIYCIWATVAIYSIYIWWSQRTSQTNCHGNWQTISSIRPSAWCACLNFAKVSRRQRQWNTNPDNNEAQKTLWRHQASLRLMPIFN